MRFLIVDDDPEARRLLRHHIEIEWPDALVEERQPGSAYGAVDALELGDADLVLLGHPLADEAEAAFDWLRRLRAKTACPPVILLARPGSESLAPEAMRAGAAGYFSKTDIKHRAFIDALRAEANGRLAVPSGDGALRGRIADDRASRGRAAHDRSPSGRHRFIRELHATDVSSIHLAETPNGERVVYKVLRASADTGGGRLFERFLQEFEIIAGLRHPNVVEIFDLGAADDRAFIVMEYLAGGTLAGRIQRGAAARAALAAAEGATGGAAGRATDGAAGRVTDGAAERATGAAAETTAGTLALAVAWLMQAARALAAVHAAGVLHRDLKPANIMFRGDGALALIDFGLAKQVRLESAITGTGKIFGTPYYMSPEQGHAEHVDERSDLYSLGCIAYELLTGAKPFTASSAMGLIYKHANAPRPRLPQPFERFQPVLDRLLAVAPAERFESADELLEVLAGYQNG